ncbi:thiamine biosynthesis protein ThiJ [Bacillus sp. M6-12]|uniref:DJ-1/PfpI family protein n=1 Tax=Bacillus sp. M6-12 TaxID=2054166 RepID=UPI000C791BD0|nr:DJ-1/PfpI family protein [Bacillus sp. M6-12]PLS14990.1 thiamine biosynthesis protein ThiJ [Bacillus sp. M6-12]
MKIVIVTFDEFTDIDVFFPWDILNRVRLIGGITDWEVKIAGTKKFHTSMAGLTIPIHSEINEIKDADAVLFSSGKGVQSLINDKEFLSSLHLNPHRQLIGSMCSGSLLLGALGLLKGKKATTYPTVVHQLKSYGVNVVEESFVNEGNISTAAGCLAGQDLASWVIKTLAGEEMVDKVIESVLPVGKGLNFK